MNSVVKFLIVLAAILLILLIFSWSIPYQKVEDGQSEIKIVEKIEKRKLDYR